MTNQESDESNHQRGSQLKRALGLPTGVLLVIGIMIGSGVFKKIIPMAQTGLNSSWILIAWIIPGIISIFGAFILSGLSTMTEESGGLYEYLRLSFGNFFSFLFGWTDFTIIGAASVAALAYMFAQTVNTLVPLPNPFDFLEHFSIAGFIYPFADSGVKMLTISCIGLLTWVNIRGVENGGFINSVITSGKVLGMLVIVVIGLFYHTPALPSAIHAAQQRSTGGPVGIGFISAFFGAMLSALWAYDGWMDISFVTGEIKNPKRNVPLAIILGVCITMLLYVLLNYVYMQVVPLSQLAAIDQNKIGAAVVAETMLGRAGKTLIVLLIMISAFGSLNAVILSHSRIYFRMAQEKYFFPKAAKVHPVFQTPHVSLLYLMGWSIVLVITGTFDMLTDMVVFASFLFNFMLSLALLKMKGRGHIAARVIGYPVLPVLMMLFSCLLIFNTVLIQPKQTLVGICLVLSGVFFYFYFRAKSAKSE